MPDITPVNKEWSILSELKATLEALTESGVAIFETVQIVTTDEEVQASRFVHEDNATLIFTTCTETTYVCEDRACVAFVTLKVIYHGDNPDDRLQGVLRLLNAAKQGILADIPDDAEALGEAGAVEDHDRLTFGEYEIQNDSRQPYAVAELPIEIAFTRSA